MIIGIIAVIVCAILGYFMGANEIIPYAFTEYIAVAILAFLDSLFGAVAATMKKEFSLTIFVTGFFGNALIAILLVYIGQKLNVDIYLAAVIVFSSRLFNNFTLMRRTAVENIEAKRAKKNKNIS